MLLFFFYEAFATFCCHITPTVANCQLVYGPKIVYICVFLRLILHSNRSSSLTWAAPSVYGWVPRWSLFSNSSTSPSNAVTSRVARTATRDAKRSNCANAGFWKWRKRKWTGMKRERNRKWRRRWIYRIRRRIGARRDRCGDRVCSRIHSYDFVFEIVNTEMLDTERKAVFILN